MAFRAFSLRDHVALMTPEASGGTAVKGLDRRLLSGNKLNVDPGAGADHMAGFGETPFGIIRKMNKPKWNIEGVSADELRIALRHVGEIGGPAFTINVIAKRPGSALWHLRCVGCELGEGGEWGVDDNGAIGKMGGPCMDVLYSVNNSPFKSIYAKIHGR